MVDYNAAPLVESEVIRFRLMQLISAIEATPEEGTDMSSACA